MNDLNKSDKLGRYIYSKHHYRPSNNTVRHTAFMPPPDRQLSIFIISGLNEEDIWSIGENLRNLKLLGRADIITNHVYKIELNIQVDNNPPRHANIINWPKENSAIKLKAMELAQNAILQLK
ncbi:MAG TPA: hypothetical protein PK527_10235 [Smithellaceae bacterium]|nr:hypothetical protein [Smithellaceae bacterium]HQB93517.1 hypothetical protein [Smithellaceae bacterium]HQM42998.1 hypothetical protein [Smithellaceae bacterium]